MRMSLLHLSPGKSLVYQTKDKLMKIEATGLFPLPLLLLGVWSQLWKRNPTRAMFPIQLGRGRCCLRGFHQMDRTYQCQAIGCISWLGM